MELLLGTLVLRPYVFAFLAVFVAAGLADLGWRRMLGFAGWVWAVAWLAEFSSTRTGVPFGLYQYTGYTQGQELFLADVPVMDSISFAFLAYSAYGLARVSLRRSRPSRATLAVASGILMMLLDVVIDPLAVRGDRWFLGLIFYYPAGGAYFGVPVSNFLGWAIVGVVGVGGWLWLAGEGRDRRPWPGAALYYGVLGFNLVVTAWIGEYVLLAAGCLLHAALALVLRIVSRRSAVSAGLRREGVQGA
jgi:putative membrane protein